MNRLIIATIILSALALGCVATVQNLSDVELVERILKAKRTGDIAPSPSNADELDFIMELPVQLFAIVNTTTDKENNKENNKEKAWNAIHHFSAIADAGTSESFDIECLRAMNKYPLIFYNRYMRGDDLALKRMDDALKADWPNGNEADIKEEKTNRKTIEQEIGIIKELKDVSPEIVQRQNKYLASLKKEHEVRKKRFRDVFGELR